METYKEIYKYIQVPEPEDISKVLNKIVVIVKKMKIEASVEDNPKEKKDIGDVLHQMYYLYGYCSIGEVDEIFDCWNDDWTPKIKHHKI